MSYAECRNVKCCNAKCRYVEYRDTILEGSIKVITGYVYWVSARKKARLYFSNKHVKSARLAQTIVEHLIGLLALP